MISQIVPWLYLKVKGEMFGVWVVTCMVPVRCAASLWREIGVLGSAGVELVAFMVSLPCPGQPTLVPGIAISVLCVSESRGFETLRWIKN